MQDFAAEEEAEMLGEGLAAAAELEARLARWQLQRLLGGPYDEGDAILSIQARATWHHCALQPCQAAAFRRLCKAGQKRPSTFLMSAV